MENNLTKEIEQGKPDEVSQLSVKEGIEFLTLLGKLSQDQRTALLRFMKSFENEEGMQDDK